MIVHTNKVIEGDLLIATRSARIFNPYTFDAWDGVIYVVERPNPKLGLLHHYVV